MRLNIRIGSQIVPVVDCTAWVVRGDAPACRKGMDLSACSSCAARESRNEDYSNLWEGNPSQASASPPASVRPAPPTPAPMRGLGDVVARATGAVGIKPCGGCKKRQEALNRLVPFAGAETPPAAPEASGAATAPPAPTDAP